MRGYSKLSLFMCETHHVVLKQFRSTAIRDLLYLQGELVHLEAEFQKAAKKDRESNEDNQVIKDLDVDWYTLSSPQNDGRPSKQWELSLRIRSVLEQYYSSVLRLREITALEQPKDSERDVINTWINSPSLNGGGWEFAGRDLAAIPTAVYEAVHTKDLMILAGNRGENDALTNFICGPALDAFHAIWKRHKPCSGDTEQSVPADQTSRMWYYSHEGLQRVTMAIITVISCLTPLSSIIILSVVKSLAARLGIICAFSMGFSLVLALATGARRVEIFACTAAFASVQVVFVGSTNAYL